MSTIHAKQQICLNITTIRCLSTYASGRYCLRFKISQITHDKQYQSKPTPTSTTNNSYNNHPHSTYNMNNNNNNNTKYAIPVSVIQYKNNIYPSCNSHNNTSSNNNQSLYDISQHVYTTKPFILKNNTQIPIYQLCIFKYDINIFNNRYQNDFHDILMMCTCQLVNIQYSGCGIGGGTGGMDSSNYANGKVISIFDGRIKGAGINDSIVIDFYQSIACQVLGSIHSCVYQFQYVYTGDPIIKYIGNTGGSNVRSNSNINNNNQQLQQNYKFNNMNPNSNSNPNLNLNLNSNINNPSSIYNKQDIIYINMTFQMYCQIQSKQYVQSLLEYLLNQVKKSQQKININLEMFQEYQGKQKEKEKEKYGSNSNKGDMLLKNIKQTQSISITYPNQYQQQHQQQLLSPRTRTNQLNHNHNLNLNLNLNPISTNTNLNPNQKLLQRMQSSIRSQTNIDIQSHTNLQTKERLSIIKQEIKNNMLEQEQSEEEQFYSNHSNDSSDSIVLDVQQQQLQQNRQHRYRYGYGYRYKGRIVGGNDDDDDCIVLDQDYQQIEQYNNNNNNNKYKNKNNRHRHRHRQNRQSNDSNNKNNNKNRIRFNNNNNNNSPSPSPNIRMNIKNIDDSIHVNRSSEQDEEQYYYQNNNRNSRKRQEQQQQNKFNSKYQQINNKYKTGNIGGGAGGCGGSANKNRIYTKNHPILNINNITGNIGAGKNLSVMEYNLNNFMNINNNTNTNTNTNSNMINMDNNNKGIKQVKQQLRQQYIHQQPSYSQQQHPMYRRKRKKIFVQSSSNNNNTNTNNNNNKNTIQNISNYSTNPTPTPTSLNNNTNNKYVSNTHKQLYNNNNNYKSKLQQQLQQLQLQQRLSSYSSNRQIPVTHIQPHPNNYIYNNQNNQNTSNISNQHTNKHPKNNISKVTIQQFQKILHNNCLNIYQKWRTFIQHLTQPQSKLLLSVYLLQYKNKLISLLGQSVIRFKGSWDIDIYSKQQVYRNKMALQIRNHVYQNQKNIMMNQFRFYNKGLFCRWKPILFQETVDKVENVGVNGGVGGRNQNIMRQQDQRQRISKNNNRKFLKISLNPNQSQQSSNSQVPPIKYIIFLVHGLGACRLDMQKIKIQLKRYYKQKVHIITSSSNQGRTQGDIQLMGIRFANQVQQQLSKYSNIILSNSRSNTCVQNIKVTFIGHSMGGIIIRSALPRLQKYKKLFNNYISLSSPHIGYNYSSSKLVDVGLWLINNWKKCQSILQLTMQDIPNTQNNTQNNKYIKNIQQTFLYKLSLQKGLQWFKKITFLSSRQDLYVPYYSARVQKHQQCLKDLKNNNQYGIIQTKMIDNILNRINGNITRIDVNFCITEQNIDNLIGRTAHINFVNNMEFIRLFCVADQGSVF